MRRLSALAIAGILLLLAAPALACLTPEKQLTAEEKSCCRKMAGSCGNMPSAHSCCQKVKVAQPSALAAGTNAPTLNFTLAAAAGDEAVAAHAPEIKFFAEVLNHHHPPPNLLAVATTVLRN